MLINGANYCMDGTMYGWIDSNYMMICKTKYIEDLMLIHIFLSITLRDGGGGEFTINITKRCLFRLIELQPVECLFGLLVESSLFLHTPSARESSVVFETALLLCRYSQSSISSSQIWGGGLFLKKLCKHLCI